ncbi:MAG TPA: hypothetical protein VN436_02300 [Holophaga sp.]|nr:hypothetical protein [Holophaga sp.]
MSREATWRDVAGPIIARVIAKVGTEDVPALRRALREAYPFEERKYWPYKVWLSEVKRQLAPTPARTVTPGPEGPLIALMEE